VEKNSLPWLAKKYNLPSVDALREFVRTKKRILDGGCGLGYTLQFFAQTNPDAEIWGYDLSPEARKWATEGLTPYVARGVNAKVVASSHLTCGSDLPNDYFDLVQSEGTIMCCPSPADAVKNLAKLVAPGGTLMVHVYRKMGPCREATDDALMKTCRELGSYEAMWEFSRFFTEVARKLHGALDRDAMDSLRAKQLSIDVPERVAKALDCQAGEQSMQQFLYEAIFQCMWDWTGGHTTVEENTQEQYDWFAPAIATRHTADEVRSWFVDAGLTIQWLGDGRHTGANTKGVTCLGTK
jgi:SAM-dependent methyltransferase